MSPKTSKKKQGGKTRKRRAPRRSRVSRRSTSEAVTTRPGQNLEARLRARTAALKQANGALRKSEARFRKIFEHAGIGIAITDMEGRFQQCNPAYCALLGYSLEEFRHLDFPALVHPEDRAANLVEAQRLKDEHIPFFEIENRYVHKDGRPVWVRKFASILPDATGKPAQFIALVTDITEQKRAAEELRQNRDALLSREEQLEALTAKLLTAHEE